MNFFGRSAQTDLATARLEFVTKKFTDREVDSADWPAARAEFYGKVHADTEDSLVDCANHMIVYLDRPVKLARPPEDADNETGQPLAPGMLASHYAPRPPVRPRAQ